MTLRRCYGQSVAKPALGTCRQVAVTRSPVTRRAPSSFHFQTFPRSDIASEPANPATTLPTAPTRPWRTWRPNLPLLENPTAPPPPSKSRRRAKDIQRVTTVAPPTSPTRLRPGDQTCHSLRILNHAPGGVLQGSDFPKSSKFLESKSPSPLIRPLNDHANFRCKADRHPDAPTATL